MIQEIAVFLISRRETEKRLKIGIFGQQKKTVPSENPENTVLIFSRREN
jgi:hypothetical protein